MKQLLQKPKSGKIEILEVPFPTLNRGQVYVRNHYSVISTGTEAATVSNSRKSYLSKALSHQEEVKKMIEMIKSDGLLPTYEKVMDKLEIPSPLGYSTAGVVIALGEGVTSLKVGDKVACGGSTASHSDVISVPANLCCKVPKGVKLKEAAFTTISSIALQGIRQADLRVGENCVIIGMGLVGQITAHILDASGIKPIGLDISQENVKLAKGTGLKYVYNRNQDGVEEQIMQLSHGHGTDAIIITAGTSSLDPIEFAGEIARKKAKVIVVGAVPTGFSRKNYYQKELELRMSTSYGPGRYDTTYEEKGIDYPIGYVRFTEQRNMQTYLQLLAEKKINVKSIITHQYMLKEASKAYSMIIKNTEPYTGILIQYDYNKEIKHDVNLPLQSFSPTDPNVGLIGAGSFAKNTLLPNLKGLCNFTAITTSKGNQSIYVGKKYGFSNIYSSVDKVIDDEKVNTLFVVTRHDTHAEFILKGIKSDKHVFAEKPMAINESELEEIRTAYKNSKQNHLMIGFNRRFSPAVQKIKSIFSNEQSKTINIRVNAGQISSDHWVNDPKIGGGRIIGEVCHFIDLSMYFAGANIISVYSTAMSDANGLNNSVVINLKFENGSVASVNYFSNGNNKLPKEYVEVFCGGTVAQIDDFKTLTIFGKPVKKIRFKGQDKGHSSEMHSFLNSIREGTQCPIPFEESYQTTLATFKVLESISTGRMIKL